MWRVNVVKPMREEGKEGIMPLFDIFKSFSSDNANDTTPLGSKLVDADLAKLA
jgi:hypothetical protein